MPALDAETLNRWRDLVVVDAEGATIGPIAGFPGDPDSERPAWALVRTGLFGDKLTVVPLAEAVEHGGEIHLPYLKTQVRRAPQIGSGGRLSPAERALLEWHYGLGARDADDDAMTRSEEELRTTIRARTRRFRLRRYVVVEEVTCIVPVRREVVRLDEVPADEPMRGDVVHPGEFELVLRREEPVIGTRVVAYERVRLVKETVGEAREVAADLRKERIELEHDRPSRVTGDQADATPADG